MLLVSMSQLLTKLVSKGRQIVGNYQTQVISDNLVRTQATKVHLLFY